MKKAAIILMGICLCLSIPVAAEAAQTGTSSVTQQSTINTTVPDTHMVTIRSEHAQVSYQHEEGDDEETQETVTYAVERFSSPQFQIQPKKGWKITAVLVNGENVTDQLKDGMLTLPDVYEDQQIVVETEESAEDDKKDDENTGVKSSSGAVHLCLDFLTILEGETDIVGTVDGGIFDKAVTAVDAELFQRVLQLLECLEEGFVFSSL